jgi:cytochrome c biogenesis protein CcdA
VLTGAALKGASATTTLLLVAYAGGAATSLALALVIGGRVFGAMKRSLGVGEWVRRVVGACVLLAVGAIALGVDTGSFRACRNRGRRGWSRPCSTGSR